MHGLPIESARIGVGSVTGTVEVGAGPTKLVLIGQDCGVLAQQRVQDDELRDACVVFGLHVLEADLEAEDCVHVGNIVLECDAGGGVALRCGNGKRPIRRGLDGQGRVAPPPYFRMPRNACEIFFRSELEVLHAVAAVRVEGVMRSVFFVSRPHVVRVAAPRGFMTVHVNPLQLDPHQKNLTDPHPHPRQPPAGRAPLHFCRDGDVCVLGAGVLYGANSLQAGLEVIAILDNRSEALLALLEEVGKRPDPLFPQSRLVPSQHVAEFGVLDHVRKQTVHEGVDVDIVVFEVGPYPSNLREGPSELRSAQGNGHRGLERVALDGRASVAEGKEEGHGEGCVCGMDCTRTRWKEQGRGDGSLPASLDCLWTAWEIILQ
mmetsp:Transcript_12232/g.24905  ORF Transcript_12232/g.24905 Transcript_12232/m.24905 type:complete len:375 (-) Transcript_12232:114-1238(-)